MSTTKSKKKKFYITTPIYYVNDRPHLGHAYTTIAADVLARYYQLQDKKVFFLTGTDEHGVKIEKAAQKAGKIPQQLCDENSEIFKKTWRNLNISYDNFIRTTDIGHIKAVQKVLQILYDKKFIYKGTYEGLYCVGCEQYKTKTDLINGKCPDHKIKPELIKEESYLFKLSLFEDILREKIESGEFEIKPEERMNEVLGFLNKGLQDISISRQRVKWGIPLPFDKKHTAYVWVDAFLNYLTGLDWKGEPKNLPEFWPPDLQLMSKDILRVHATIWPSLLLALDIPLPNQLFIHGYFTINGQKMSKSLGNVIWPEEMIEKFGVDATRYLLLSACSFGKDGDISWEGLNEKYNTDLSNGIGNTVRRVLTIGEKKFKGIVPAEKRKGIFFVLRDFILEERIYPCWSSLNKIFHYDKCLFEILNGFKEIDKEIEEKKPWEWNLNETTSQEIFYSWLESIRLLTWMLLPFMPTTADEIFKQLGLDSAKKQQEKKDFKFEKVIKWGGLPSGIKTKKSKPLFPRI